MNFDDIIEIVVRTVEKYNFQFVSDDGAEEITLEYLFPLTCGLLYRDDFDDYYEWCNYFDRQVQVSGQDIDNICEELESKNIKMNISYSEFDDNDYCILYLGVDY